MKTLLAAFIIISACIPTYAETTKPPNVLLIGVDDLNDWIGCLDGHPQALTPNMDYLASQGTLFTNAHCQSPVCNPSRASLGTSLYPSTSGIYFLSPDISASPVAKKNQVMPKRFQQDGYAVSAAGKIFHGGTNKKHFPNWAGSFGGFGPRPKKKLSSFPGHPLWDWGKYPDKDEEMPDYKIAEWTVNALAKHDPKKPFFMGCGFYRPHVPQFAPKKWFDMFPIDEVQLPKMHDGDLKDLSQYAIDLTREEHVAPTHEWVLKSNEWKAMVQSYLACVAFVDAQVGTVIKALEASPHRDNTYVVLFSDHGFHIGEKDRHAKRSLWEDGARVPLMIMGPGIKKGQVCHKPVELLDIYPTLLDLAGLKKDPNHEGQSLKPLLNNPNANWTHFARTEFGPKNYAIVSEGYRYIHYADGSEELYDKTKDPHEWHNQASNPEYASVLKNHRAQAPTAFHPVLGKGSTGHKAFSASAKKK